MDAAVGIELGSDRGSFVFAWDLAPSLGDAALTIDGVGVAVYRVFSAYESP